MSKPFFSVRHLESLSDLPENMEIGRAYFIDDEQIIVINHGRGPIYYGGKIGPQGAAGEPIPQLQDQIDSLVDAEFKMQKIFWDTHKKNLSEFERIDNEREILAEQTESHFSQITEKHEADIQALTEKHDEEIAQVRKEAEKYSINAEEVSQARYSHLEEASAKNSEAIISLTKTMNEQFAKYDSSFAIIAKSISELYSAHVKTEYEDPLDNEIVSTDYGDFVIQQTILNDGTIILNLTPVEITADKLTAGDTVSYDGQEWEVVEKTDENGVTSLTLKQK